jgi:hypothetical protein
MALRAKLDPANKVLLPQFEGKLSDESVAEFYRVIRKYWITADASMGIVDFSSVTEFLIGQPDHSVCKE